MNHSAQIQKKHGSNRYKFGRLFWLLAHSRLHRSTFMKYFKIHFITAHFISFPREGNVSKVSVILFTERVCIVGEGTACMAGACVAGGMCG